MRIVSKFKDYYDSASSYGSDEGCTFIRHSSEGDSKLSSVVTWFQWGKYTTTRDDCYFEQFWIGFCGKLYYGVEKHIYGVEKRQFFYGEDAIKEMEWYLKINRNEKVPKYLRRLRRGPRRLTTSDIIRQQHSSKWFTQFDQLKVPIIVVNKRERNFKSIVTVNDVLSQYEFGKVIEPNQAYQQIQYYLMNDLNPGMEMPDFGDKYKLLSHGMDNTSFKREKGGPTRKRKKQKHVQS